MFATISWGMHKLKHTSYVLVPYAHHSCGIPNNIEDIFTFYIFTLLSLALDLVNMLFEKWCSEKIHSRLNIVIRASRALVGILLAHRRSIGSMYWFNAALVQCIVSSGVSGAGMRSVTRITMQQLENTVQSPNAVSMSASVEECW